MHCIEEGLVFVNGKLITSNGYEPKEGDIISVRKKGRFIYDGVSRQTKKDVLGYGFCFISEQLEENAMTASKLLVKREGDFHYPICFEEDFSNLAQVMKEEGLVDRKICIVTDSNVGPLYEESVKQVLSEVSSDISVFTFEAGEKNKNLNTVSALYQALIQNGLDRKSLLVALGGGVVGDLTGFGAATYLRGLTSFRYRQHCLHR